ncbi:hypothetical protein CFC21_023423 [Triticum aestivum]|uniref:Uncharacterized protein n=3 Tax=Triticum TaxID=4564 RepID=A0A9R1PNU8_TRITD|nr:hypothetical protein CFC21_023423 [Triticum aestivum]VAH46662.1 unnamed protein product [Triticum turgidum subsp. durum]
MAGQDPVAIFGAFMDFVSADLCFIIYGHDPFAVGIIWHLGMQIKCVHGVGCNCDLCNGFRVEGAVILV